MMDSGQLAFMICVWQRLGAVEAEVNGGLTRHKRFASETQQGYRLGFVSVHRRVRSVYRADRMLCLQRSRCKTPRVSRCFVTAR